MVIQRHYNSFTIVSSNRLKQSNTSLSGLVQPIDRLNPTRSNKLGSQITNGTIMCIPNSCPSRKSITTELFGWIIAQYCRYRFYHSITGKYHLILVRLKYKQHIKLTYQCKIVMILPTCLKSKTKSKDTKQFVLCSFIHYPFSVYILCTRLTEVMHGFMMCGFCAFMCMITSDKKLVSL